MKKNGALLAVLGLAVLTGCKTEVMGERPYKPLKNEEAVANARDVEGFGDVQGQTGTVPAPAPFPAETSAPAPAPAAAPAAQPMFAPMEGVKSSGGITGKAARRSGKSTRAVSGKGGVYIVQPGDYPGKIARKNRVSLAALLEVNKLTPESSRRLRIGQKLIIPGGKAAVRGRKAAAGKKAAVTAGKGFYIVQSGDYPERIARKNRVSLKALLQANNLTEQSSRRLRIGQKLIIPGAGSTAAAAPAAKPAAKPAAARTEAPAVTPAEQPAAKTAGTQVDAADALERELEQAAPAAQTSAAAAAASPAASDLIEIAEETTIQALAEKYKTTESHLRALNEGFTGNTIAKGSYFFIPPQK